MVLSHQTCSRGESKFSPLLVREIIKAGGEAEDREWRVAEGTARLWMGCTQGPDIGLDHMPNFLSYSLAFSYYAGLGLHALWETSSLSLPGRPFQAPTSCSNAYVFQLSPHPAGWGSTTPAPTGPICAHLAKLVCYLLSPANQIF